MTKYEFSFSPYKLYIIAKRDGEYLGTIHTWNPKAGHGYYYNGIVPVEGMYEQYLEWKKTQNANV